MKFQKVGCCNNRTLFSSYWSEIEERLGAIIQSTPDATDGAVLSLESSSQKEMFM